MGQGYVIESKGHHTASVAFVFQLLVYSLSQLYIHVCVCESPLSPSFKNHWSCPPPDSVSINNKQGERVLFDKVKWSRCETPTPQSTHQSTPDHESEEQGCHSDVQGQPTTGSVKALLFYGTVGLDTVWKNVNALVATPSVSSNFYMSDTFFNTMLHTEGFIESV